jgi:pyruvate dehydrogenase E1 component beta subunit
MPITIRIPWAGGVGAAEHHSESPEAYFVHTAGLRVVAVSNPQDAYTMLQQAIACDDPVVFFEPKRLYHTKGRSTRTLISPTRPDGTRACRTRRHDVTLLTYGAQTVTALDAAAPPTTRGSLSRSSICARSHPSTIGPSLLRCERPDASSSRTRRRVRRASGPS